MWCRRPARRLRKAVRYAVVGALVAAGLASCGDDVPGRVAELSIHYRQLPNGGLAAVGTHGLHICQNEPDVDLILVTVDSVPPGDTTPDGFLWTCEELSHD